MRENFSRNSQPMWSPAAFAWSRACRASKGRMMPAAEFAPRPVLPAPQVLVTGCGRIGRSIVRLLLRQGAPVALRLHDPGASPELIRYLLRHDSTYGTFGDTAGDVEVLKSVLLDDAWEEAGADLDVVVDCRTAEVAARDSSLEKAIDAGGVRRVIVTRPESDTQLWLEGVTDLDVVLRAPRVSTTSCDVLAMAPVLSFLTSRFSIDDVALLTLHPWLSDQYLVDRAGGDLPSFELHRAAPLNLIPKETSAIAELANVIPELGGKLGGFSYRVPTAVVTAAVLSIRTHAFANVDAWIEALHEFAGQYDHVQLTDEPLVSSDIIGNESICVVDLGHTRRVGTATFQLPMWYDNEVGYAAHVCRLILSCLGW
jgi:glyceraldehyde 3-phosphate dehydrogenase